MQSSKFLDMEKLWKNFAQTKKIVREWKNLYEWKCVYGFTKNLTPKCKDSGMFMIPFKIRDVNFSSVMLDLGVYINFTPYSVYESLNFGSLNEMGVIFLGRMFFKMARTKIDLHAGNLTMEFDGKIISFNI